MTFMKFLGLNWKSTVPDEKSVWLFRDQLTKADLIKLQSARFSHETSYYCVASCRGNALSRIC